METGITTGVLAGANSPDGRLASIQDDEVIMGGLDNAQQRVTQVTVPVRRQVNGREVVNALPSNLATSPLGPQR